VGEYSALKAIAYTSVSGDEKNRIRPADNLLHVAYTFYIKATTIGGSYAIFGPYELKIGCTSSSVTIT